MKKTMCLIIIISLLTLPSCINGRLISDKKNKTDNSSQALSKAETVAAGAQSEGKNNMQFRAVWISCYDIEEMTLDADEARYRKNVSSAVGKIASSGLNTVIFQVRAFSDALYLSDIFPQSKYTCGKSGGNAEYDAFGIFIEYAAAKKLSVHAWINPFRVSYKNDFALLPESSPAKKIYEKKKK